MPSSNQNGLRSNNQNAPSLRGWKQGRNPGLGQPEQVSLTDRVSLTDSVGLTDQVSLTDLTDLTDQVRLTDQVSLTDQTDPEQSRNSGLGSQSKAGISVMDL